MSSSSNDSKGWIVFSGLTAFALGLSWLVFSENSPLGRNGEESPESERSEDEIRFDFGEFTEGESVIPSTIFGLPLFDAAAHLQESEIEILLCEAYAREHEENFIEAEQKYREVLLLDDLNQEALIGLCHTLRHLSQFENALFFAKKCITLNQKNTRAWYEMGILYQILENFADAIISLDHVLSSVSSQFQRKAQIHRDACLQHTQSSISSNDSSSLESFSMIEGEKE